MTRKTQKRGSHRPAERRLRTRLRAVIEKQRDYIVELSELMRQEQSLIAELDHTPPRAEEVSKFDAAARRKAHDTLTQYIVKLTQLRDYTKDFMTVIDELDELDSHPRLLPVRDVDSATTSEHITSLLDGSQFQILTRSLVGYNITADDVFAHRAVEKESFLRHPGNIVKFKGRCRTVKAQQTPKNR